MARSKVLNNSKMKKAGKGSKVDMLEKTKKKKGNRYYVYQRAAGKVLEEG